MMSLNSYHYFLKPDLIEMNYIQELLDGSKYTHLNISKHLDS